MNDSLVIEREAGAHGLKAKLGYDPYSELSPPKRVEEWKIITNKRDHRMREFDGTYDVDQFYDDASLTEWFRETHDGYAYALIRYESHGPYGRFLIDQTFGHEDVITKGWSCEAIAVITKENAEKLGGVEQAQVFLKWYLEARSDWAHGQVYRYSVYDHRGEVVETEGLIYDLDNARDRMKDALAEAEEEVEREIQLTAEWAARDVVTIGAVPGAIGAGT